LQGRLEAYDVTLSEYKNSLGGKKGHWGRTIFFTQKACITAELGKYLVQSHCA